MWWAERVILLRRSYLYSGCKVLYNVIFSINESDRILDSIVLTKVVSSIICVEDFGILEKYAKVCYTQNLLKIPTISHMVRY